MSFANYDLEAQKDVGKRGSVSSQKNSDASHLDTIIRNTSHQIQTYGSLVASFNNERKLLGSRRDSAQLREKLDSSQKNIVSLGGAVRKLIADISAVMSDSADGNNSKNNNNNSNHEVVVSNRQLMMKDRLVAEFGELEATFDRCAKNHQEKVANIALPHSTKSQFNESSPLLGGSSQAPPNQGPPQAQAQMMQMQEDQDLIEQTELQYHMMLTEERNRQIEQVAEGIREVNSIFKDLGELVSQQGEQLDTVEENVLQMSANAHDASRELTKAHEYQKKKSRWSCILLVALCVFLLVIVLVVLS
ncbi:hypothetical protein JCM33374_g1871 [Metschnikowia sp. JCM 33374]|nr:hypothetical protein JCM33374_g1871 [Metschnikowia sp. JCM 33374]